MSVKLWVLLIILSVLWGGSFFFAEIALNNVSPFMLVTLRVAIASAVLFFYILITKQAQKLDMKTWMSLFVMGALNNVIPFTLIFWGQVHIESGLASILNATTPLFTVLLAHLMTQDEKLTSNKLIGVLIGFVGVMFLIGPVAFSGHKAQALGQIAVLFAAVSYAFAGIWGKRLRSLPSAVSSGGMLFGSTLIMLIVLLLKGESFELNISVSSWTAILALAIFSTVIAYMIYFYILTQAGATNLLLVTFLIPVSALVLGVVFLNETFTTNAIIGMSLIILSLISIDGRLIKSLPNKKFYK